MNDLSLGARARFEMQPSLEPRTIVAKKKNEKTTFAVGLDGEIYLSVFEMDGVETIDDALAMLRSTKYFIGIVTADHEKRRVLSHLRSAGREAAAFVAGARRWHRTRRP